MNSLTLLAAVSPTMLAVPIGVLFIVIAILLVIKFVASRYIKVGPDEIAVFSGRKYKYKAPDGNIQERGFYILQGGGKILYPIVEKVMIIKIGAFQVEVGESNIPNKDNVGVTVKGIASCRLSLASEDLANAVSNFLDKSDDERVQFIQNILKGHVRSIVGNLDMDQLLRERSKINEQVVTESATECKRVGIEIINLVIQDIRDEHGYIEALGRQKIASTMRDANIATAEAERDTAVRTSAAKREAAEAEAQNAVKIAAAQKDRDVKVAEFKQETETKRAAAETAFAIAQAAQQKDLKVAEADRDSAATKAQIQVQDLEAQRKEKELEATTITTANAEAKAMSIRAAGQQKAQEIEAQTRKSVASLNAETVRVEAEGKKNALALEGEGEARKLQSVAEAQAVATQKTKTAEAEGQRATLLAQAEGEKARLLAVAEGTKAAKLADAEGTEKLAEALRKLDEKGQLMLILDRLPILLDHGGDAGAKIAKAIFDPIGQGVGKIGDVTITDLGNGDTAKKGIASIGGLVPQIAMDFFAQAKARGIDVSGLAQFLKMDPAKLMSMLGPIAGLATPAPEKTLSDTPAGKTNVHEVPAGSAPKA